MRPRIRKINGLWYCYAFAVGCGAVGFAGMGYTPAHAYSDWYGANRKVARA